jgi:hypothetical protein
VTLDDTDAASIADAVALATDVTLVVNDAGAANGASVVDDQASLRELFEVNFFAPLAYAGALAGALEILADDASRQVKAGLSGPIDQLCPPARADLSRAEVRVTGRSLTDKVVLITGVGSRGRVRPEHADHPSRTRSAARGA